MNSPSTTFPDNCEDALEYLRKSPTFAMSLGAKELFHTNFLAYLLEYKSNDETLKSIQTRLKVLLFGDAGIGRVITWREKYSLDLVIMPAPVIEENEIGLDGVDPKSKKKLTIAVVIEAKLKSIPTEQQLNEYDSKLKSGITFELDDIDQQTCNNINYKFMKLCGNDKTPGIELLSENNKKGGIKKFPGKIRRILLGPTAPKETGWEHIIWNKVITCLVIESNKREILQCKETELLQSLICDYRESLDNILKILSCTNDHAITNQNTTYKIYYDAITDKRFRDLRIHDLVGKYANNVLEWKIFEKLKILFYVNFIFEICGKSFMLNSYTFFSNQQPGVTFEWLCKAGKLEVSFGVTIQGNDYRHFISVNGKNDVDRNLVLAQLEIILGNDDKNGWFLFHKNKRLILGKKKLAKTTTFYVFTKSKFRYSKATVNSLTLIELSEAVFNSLDKAKIMVTERCSDLCPQLLKFFKEPSS